MKYDFIENFNKDQINTETFCKALSLCHGGKTRRKKTSTGEYGDLIQDYLDFQDETILNFAKKCGCSFESALLFHQMNAYKIFNCGKLEYYQILGINYSTAKRQRFSIVFKNELIDPVTGSPVLNENLSHATLYIKGNFESMRSILLLKECEKETLKEMIESFTESGYLTLIYGKKELTQEEAEEYVKLMFIYKSSLTMEDYEVENIFSKFEDNITFLTMICLEWKQDSVSNETIKAMKQAQIKTSYLSGDNKINTLIGAYKNGILSSEDEYLNLNGENFDTLLFGIKTFLHRIKKSLEKDFDNKENNSLSAFSWKYYVMLSYKSFRIIMENKYLKSHFHFILHLSCGMIGYDFDAKGKKKLVKWVKSKYGNENNILSMGFSVCDSLMLQKSSFSIEFLEENKILACSGDLILSNKVLCNEFLFKESLFYKKRFFFVLSNVLHLSLILSWPIVFLHFFNENYLCDILKHKFISKAMFSIGFFFILKCFPSKKPKHFGLSQCDYGLSFFLKQEYNNNFPNLMINISILSFIDSLNLYIIWSIYHYNNEIGLHYHNLFLPTVLQISSFAIFTINVF